MALFLLWGRIPYATRQIFLFFYSLWLGMIMKTSPKLFCLSFFVLLNSMALSSGQTFPTQYGDVNTATNILTPVPSGGTLLIDYEFYGVPDTMDVYYDGAGIFSSESTHGAGQFSIPYGPGLANSLLIVMNQGSDVDPNTLWMYTPTVVPEPNSVMLFCFGLSTLALWRRRQHVIRAVGWNRTKK